MHAFNVFFYKYELQDWCTHNLFVIFIVMINFTSVIIIRFNTKSIPHFCNRITFLFLFPNYNQKVFSAIF